MGASRVLAGCLLMLTAAVCSVAQDASAPSGQASSEPSSQSSSSSKPQGHRSVHHIQVEDDDSPAQPAELIAAESAIEKRDYAAAEPLLRKLLGHEPASYVGWFDLGFVENELGRLDDSIAAYRKSVAARPDVFESNLNLGLQLAKTGQPEAEQFLRAATQLKPTAHMAKGQYRAWLSLGETIEKSKPEEALAAYQRAAALQPKEAEPHLSAGQLLEQENKYGAAEQEYKQALALDPRSTDAVMGLANIYMRGSRFPEAEEYLRKLSTANGDSAAVHIQLGRVLAAEGKADAAVAELQAGLKLAPGDHAAQRDLADVYVAAGKNDLAEAAFRALLVAHPNEADLHDGLGKALLWQKKSPEAQREFITAVTLKPNFGGAYYDLAFAANDNKDYPVIIRALDARAKLLPETPMTYFLRASAYDHLRDFKKAAANYHLFLNNAGGKYPDQEWQAKHRLIAIEPKR
ncbi:MAG: tetratricopeptide repeat protein [Candidatus Sulfotelmatobacter sp.]